MEGGVMTRLAAGLGTSEDILVIFISLLLGYPLAVVHRKFVSHHAPFTQHLYFTTCGILLSLFNFGWSTYHSVLNILLIYAVLKLFGGHVISVILAFAINMTYLTVGYYLTMTDTYVVSWTTPQCVLTLRLIGLVFDVYDGKRLEASLSEEERQTALREVPSLLEISAHSYFFGGFLVGPQFSMKRYQEFVSKRLRHRYDVLQSSSATTSHVSSIDGEKPRAMAAHTEGKGAGMVGSNGDSLRVGGEDGGVSDCVRPALLRLFAGVGYTFIYQIGCAFCSDSILLDESFVESSLFYKIVVVAVWGKLTLYKYLGCWLLAEGACIMTGMTYNGRDKKGAVQWNGCANIHIKAYEKASTCQEVIQAFNINTNKWMAKYVFKRLKFLGNKDLSQGVTLFFLALWHGLHSGYFMNFFLEYLEIKFEREWTQLIGHSSILSTLSSSTLGSVTLWSLKKFYMLFILGYALISFCLFSYDKYLTVYKSLYFCGHIFLLVLWPVLFTVLRKQQKSKRKPE